MISSMKGFQFRIFSLSFCCNTTVKVFFVSTIIEKDDSMSFSLVSMPRFDLILCHECNGMVLWLCIILRSIVLLDVWFIDCKRLLLIHCAVTHIHVAVDSYALFSWLESKVFNRKSSESNDNSTLQLIMSALCESVRTQQSSLRWY